MHSDQGLKYTSKRYNQLLERNNINGNISRKGNCFDNACIEVFLTTLKQNVLTVLDSRLQKNESDTLS